MDGIFVLFKESVHLFRKYMSSKNQYINVGVEYEDIGSLSILDVKLCRKKR